MKVKIVAQTAFASVFVVACASDANAECARIVETMAQRYARHQLVFFGEVLQLETVVPDSAPSVNRVRFKVDQPYKGTNVGEHTFDIGPRTAEDFIFIQGQQVLVWARTDPNNRDKFSTTCSPTRTAKADDSELTELGKLSSR
jgi:hypothetical protein